MDHQHHSQAHRGCGEGEPARSRWAPKPEQILILESIFNSGMVNPAKDETARIRRILERFGAVRDANVFYWFQNRRSRSRRRARQLQQQASCDAVDHQLLVPSSTPASHHAHGGVTCSPSFLMHYGQGASAAAAPAVPSAVTAAAASHFLDDVDGGADDLFAISRQMGLTVPTAVDDHRCSSYRAVGDGGAPQLMSYQQTGSTMIQVFIDGTAFEVPSALDVAGTFGCDAMLVHSSGEILPVNEHGVLIKSLQMGECYYVVSRSI